MRSLKKYLVVPNTVLDDENLNNNELRLLINIIRYNEIFSKDKATGKEKENYSYNNSWLAEKSNITGKTFKKAIKHLKELGYILEGRKSHHYELNYAKMGYEGYEGIEKMEEPKIPIPETLKEPKEEPAEEPIEEKVEDTETKPEPEPDTEPKEEEPQIIEKDWYRMNARLDGAERMSQDLNAFLVSNQSDLEESGFTREEIVEEYYKRFDMTA